MSAHFTELRRIETSGGEVIKALTADEPDFKGLGEAYFSRVNPRCVRAWKRHNEMTVNVVVPVGHVRFVVADGSDELGYTFEHFDLGEQFTHGRLTIDPGTWFGFMGGEAGGLVLNLSDIVHRPDEADGRDVDDFDYDWQLSDVAISAGSTEEN